VSGFRCRACGSDRIRLILSLGRTPLANALLSAGQLAEPEDTYPLDLVFCEACTLVQITETVPPERLFCDYPYFSSYSDTMLEHARAIAGRMIRERGLGAGSLAVEIASNDGYLLQYYAQAGVQVLGIEPAGNIARVAEERGVVTLVDFFSDAVAARLRADGVRADIIHANNVLAHVPDLPGFARGLRAIMKDTGRAVVEVPYVRDLVDRREFDTIYHEHLSYFSLTAIARLLAPHDLTVVDIELLPIHGGSLRVTVAPDGAPAVPAVQRLLEEEERTGVTRFPFYERFAAAVHELRDSLTALLRELRGAGRQLAAYGAAAKGSTLLNYCGIGRDLLDFVADRSPHKQGKFMPGVRLPIVAPSRLLEERPDYVLLLTWNFADEILEQQAEFRHLGGHFIVPVPDVSVV
jgi:SAM-dependent methyltransferase